MHAAILDRSFSVAGATGVWYVGFVKLAEIEQQALALPDRDRASLAAKLLDTLPPTGTDVSDEEVEQRERDLDSGQVTPILHDEFVRKVGQQRGR